MRGAKVEHRFPFENIYVEDVHIASIRSSCGCTKPSVVKTLLKTYDQSEIVATVDTRSFTGRREATVTVDIDRPFRAEVQLHVYAYIRQDVVVQPGEAKFESVAQGTPANQTLTVTYAGRADWQILQVKTASPYLQATAVERSRVQGLVTYDLEVQLKPNIPAGYLRDQLILVTNDRVTSASQVPVAVEAMIVPAVQVRPSPLSLGILRPGQPAKKVLVVQGKRPFRVLSVTSADGRFKFEVPGEAKDVQLVPVTFLPDDKPGRIVGKIRIETDVAGAPVLEVKVDGQIVPLAPAAPTQAAPPAGTPAPAAPGTPAGAPPKAAEIDT